MKPAISIPPRSLAPLLAVGAWLLCGIGWCQQTTPVEWIRPQSAYDHPQWGIKNGVVIGLWATPMEEPGAAATGGPRGLFRVGFHSNGKINQMNFIAVEPVVDGKIEYSEISPSIVDGHWGKLMWAGSTATDDGYLPFAATTGVITHPDPSDPQVEELSFYVFMERFHSGAHPYFKVSIRSDRPQEIAFEVFHRSGSSSMQRCTLTATMGNYARLRKLHLKDQVVNSRELYKGFEGIDFIEKDPYPLETLYRTAEGDVLAVMETDESLAQLMDWPESEAYLAQQSWRYRPSYKVVQYWRKDAEDHDPSLRVRVNGRAKYWAVASENEEDYVAIPGGPSFENFELRENYRPGQKVYFGISRLTAEEVLEIAGRSGE